MSFGDIIVRGLADMMKLTFWIAFQVIAAIVGKKRTSGGQKVYKPKTFHISGLIDTSTKSLATFEITLPENVEWDMEAAQRLISYFGNKDGDDFLVEIQGDPGSIKWRVGLWVDVDTFEPDTIADAIASFYPQAEVNLATYQEPWDSTTKVRTLVPYTLAAIYPAPIYTVDNVKGFDPLNPITQAMSNLKQGERVRMSIFFTPAPQNAAEAGNNLLTGSDLSWFNYLTLDGAVYAEVRRRQGYDQHNVYQPHLDRVMRKKLSSKLYHAVAILEIQSISPESTLLLRDQMLPHVAHYANPPFNSIEPVVVDGDEEVFAIDTENLHYSYTPASVFSAVLAGELNDFKDSWMVLTEAEIAALWHLPHAGLTADSIQWNDNIYAPLPKAMRDMTQADGVLVGTSRVGRNQHDVYWSNENLSMHAVIAGKNGTGKSSLMHHHIRSHINAGNGAVVLDPKGTLIPAILQHSIPSGQESRVVVVDLEQMVDGVWYPPPINLLARDPSAEATVANRQLLNIMSAWFKEFSGRKMAETMNMILMALSIEDSPTLVDAIRLLEDEVYREDIVRRLPDDEFVVRDFWAAFSEKSEKQREAECGPIRWRLRDFYNNKWLRAVTCHPGRLDLHQLISDDKIVLISLADTKKRFSDQERYLLGAVLISQIDIAVRAGAVRNQPYMLYIDEAQEFSGTDLPNMLSQLRQFGLGIVLANQYLRQLEGATLDAIEGNVSTLISFEVGARDAGVLGEYMSPEISKHDLTHLGKYRAAVSQRHRNERQPAFVMHTLPPVDQSENQQRENKIRRLSVESYTPKSYSEVTDSIKQAYATQQTVAAGGDEDGIFE